MYMYVYMYMCVCFFSTLLMDLQMGLMIENELLSMTEMALFYW